MSKYTRKIPLVWSPELTVSDQTITLKTGGWKGETRFEATAQISPYCAAILIKKLRTSLRQIRDAETKRLNELVESAEGPLS